MPSRKRVPNPHDAFFRRVFSDVAVATEFLRRYLPPTISAALDLTSVQLEETSLTDHKLRRHAADLLFRVQLIGGGEAYVLVLLEHKSAPDERVALQVLRYAVLKWDRLSLPLPLILPVVLYHGAKPWRIGKKFRSLFAKLPDGGIWRRYLPDFEYHLLDLSAFSDEELEGSEGLGAVLKLLKHIFRPDLEEEFLGAIRETANALPEASAKERVETMLVYVKESDRLDNEAIKRILSKASREGDKMDNILLEIGRWYNPEAVEAAAQESTRRATMDLTLALLNRKFGELDEDLVETIHQLPTDDLKRLGVDLLGFQSRADLENWLRQRAQPTEYKN